MKNIIIILVSREKQLLTNDWILDIIFSATEKEAGDIMHKISDELLHELRKQYPKGIRVKLIKMNDPYNTKLAPGCLGTVRCVDDVGTIHVQWIVALVLALFMERICVNHQ